jgi:glycosyltransferase involved in cell wall biosynthesis
MNIFNVLNYSPEFGGGICKHLIALGELSKEKGHRIYLAFPKERDWQKDLKQNSEIIIIPEILNPFWSGYSKVIYSYCEKYSIDILHIHFTFAQNLALACSLKQFKIPVIYHWHNPPKAINGFYDSPIKLKNSFIRYLSKTLAHFADKRVIRQHITVSNYIRNLLIEHRWIIKEKIKVLPNGVSFRVSENVMKKSKFDNKGVIGTVANFRPEKDHITLVHAFKKIIMSNIDCELWLVGDGPTRKNIELLVEKLDLEKKVRFWGTVLDPSELYKQMDVFVLSTHYEGHPLVVLEAMSFGLPIVASRISSIPEVITDNYNGLLFNPGDSTHLATTLMKLLEDKKLFERISNTSLETVRSLPHMDDWANRVLDVYEQALKQNPN